MKKLLLFSIYLLIASGAFAQMTVMPNGDSDSYVYVKNQILYVEKDINMTLNNSLAETGTQASIYLRGTGQLIQGDNSSLNKGSGQLSVQQNSSVTNAWAYYYWCSPIGNPGTKLSPTAPGSRNFGVNFLYDPFPSSVTGAKKVNTTTNYDGLNTIPITVSTRWLYTHMTPGTEAEGQYDRMHSNNAALPGFGFTMKGVGTGLPGGNQVYEFRGRPNNGDFSIPVMGSSNGEAAMMTLSGNPYPSALDLNQVFYETGNDALNSFFYYDEDRNIGSHYYSTKPFGYGVWVPGGRDLGPDYSINSPPGNYVRATFYIWNKYGHQGTSPGSGTTQNNKRYAPIGQGIMFVGESNGNVKIKNSHRIFVKEGDPGSVFQKTSDNYINDNETTTQNDPNRGPTISSNINVDMPTPQLRLYVVFDGALTRDMLLLFSDDATDGYDRGFDGLSPGGMDSDAFFPIRDNNETLPYVIQGTNYDGNKQIPITLKLHKSSKVDILAVEEIRKPYRTVYLFDKLENTYAPLHSETVNSSFTLPAGVYEDRFYIVFRNPNLSSDIPEEEMLAKAAVQKNVNFFQNNPAKQMEISNPDGYTFKAAAIYDMAGKLVITKKNLGDDTKYSFYTGNLSDGVYLVKLTASEDITIDYKAIVHNK